MSNPKFWEMIEASRKNPKTCSMEGGGTLGVPTLHVSGCASRCRRICARRGDEQGERARATARRAADGRQKPVRGQGGVDGDAGRAHADGEGE
jgi:hypothetical protein